MMHTPVALAPEAAKRSGKSSGSTLSSRLPACGCKTAACSSTSTWRCLPAACGCCNIAAAGGAGPDAEAAACVVMVARSCWGRDHSGCRRASSSCMQQARVAAAGVRAAQWRLLLAGGGGGYSASDCCTLHRSLCCS